ARDGDRYHHDFLSVLTTWGQSGASGCRTINHWQLGGAKALRRAAFWRFRARANRFQISPSASLAPRQGYWRVAPRGHHRPEGANQLCSLGISAKPPTWRIVKVLPCYG